MSTETKEPSFDLTKVHETNLKLLKEIDRICRKYKIKYALDSGTLLGAIRHQGFIPWDDDMDIGMPREDYERFLELAPGELTERYELLEARKTPGYVLPFAKLTRADTTFVEATDQDRTYHSGIFIDIFPFDLIYEDPKKRDKLLRRSWILARLCVLSEYKRPKLPQGLSPAKGAIAHFGCAVIHYGLRLLGQNGKELHQRYVDTMTRPAREGAEGLYTDAVLYRLEDNYGQTDVCYPAEVLFPTVTVPFDGMEAAVPGDYDRYLTRTFGDYMQLPPEDKRHCHFPAVLDFGDTEKEPV